MKIQLLVTAVYVCCIINPINNYHSSNTLDNPLACTQVSFSTVPKLTTSEFNSFSNRFFAGSIVMFKQGDIYINPTIISIESIKAPATGALNTSISMIMTI